MVNEYKYVSVDNQQVLEVILTRGKVMICDVEDLHEVQTYNWFSLSTGRAFYACRCVRKDGKTSMVMFHNSVLNHTDFSVFTVDHINHQTLDNRRSNLRLASISSQLVNRRVFKNNRTGYTGISLANQDKTVIASWFDDCDKQCRKVFSVRKHGKDEAIQLAKKWRDEAISTIKKYAILRT